MSTNTISDLVEKLRAAKGSEKEVLLNQMRSFDEREVLELLYDWKSWARKGQLEPLSDIYGRPWPEGKLWRNFLVLAGRGFGKMLSITEPVPTPNGWTTMGELQVGDVIFDESGNVCSTTLVSDIEIPEKAYRLYFSDGTIVDACSEHQWITWTHAERKSFLRSTYEDTRKFPENWPQWKLLRSCGGAEPKTYPDSPGPRIRTTREIVATLTFGKRQDTNHCIPNCAPLILPKQIFEIDPYVLGVWLGNGSSSETAITSHQLDVPFIRQHIENCGFSTSYRSDPLQFGILGIFQKLASLNLIKNKHVPSQYLRGSIDQRLSLLQGLMDTDGGWEAAGTVSFCNTNKQIIESAYEIICSLGMRATIDSRFPKYYYNGSLRPAKEAWRITFTPTMQVFRLPRKAAKLTFDKSQALRKHHRMIVGAEEIDSVPMRCIMVDSPNSMYLVGKSMVPTHNTKIGAEKIRGWAESGEFKFMSMVGSTAADVRDVMVGGQSGLINCCPPWNRPKFQESRRRVIWENSDYPSYRAQVLVFSAEEPERLRGPQHEKIWMDELLAWKYPKDTFDMAMMGLRVGRAPQNLITSTPKPLEILVNKKWGLLHQETTALTVGTTYENIDNLDPGFFEDIVSKYEGTRLGDQELRAAVLQDIPGALWHRDNIEHYRLGWKQRHLVPTMLKVVVAIDPAGSTSTSAAETGMCVAGFGDDGHFYILDISSMKAHPDVWAKKALDLYDEFQADEIVVETNYGGEMATNTIQMMRPFCPIVEVKASRGKIIRAEPVALLYERGRIHHVGTFPSGEDQMTAFNPRENAEGLCDQVDALVWATTRLIEFAQPNSAVGRPKVLGQRDTLLRYNTTFSRFA